MFGKKKNIKAGPSELSAFLSRMISHEIAKHPSVNTDHWVKHMVVERPRAEDTDVIDFRIFDKWETDQAKLDIIDYSSLDAHPQLILYEGWYNKKAKKSEVRYKKAA